MNGSITEGMSLALARHIENFRDILTKYNDIVKQNSELDNDKLYLLTSKLLDDPVMKEIEQMQFDYIRNLYRYMI